MSQIDEQLQRALGDAYRVERELGGGGMSRVYVAEEVRFRRRVVIKVLSGSLAEGLSAERFEREVMLAAQLQQANIVPVITAGDIEGVPYYTMPFVEGESLRTRLSRGELRTGEAVAVLRDVARALAYAHERGIVHRDIKPENILLSGGAAVVTDFGIAKAISASRTQAPGGTLTVVGTSLGTPSYMAPEQAVGDVVDHRADIYAWGVVAYELLCGTHPFSGKTTSQQMIAAHIAEQPRPIAQVRKEVPPGLAALVMSSLDKTPNNRPQSAEALLQSLEGGAFDRVSESALSGWSAHRNPRRIAGLAAGIIALGAAVYGASYFAGAGDEVADSTAPTTAAISPGIRTIAVLPFVNTGGSAQDEYFSDGMTDELAHALSRLPEVRVAARTSTYAFKGKTASVQEIGKALNVAGVVEGTVRRAGSRLRVTAQLTSAHDGLVVWSDTYETSATDVFQVQDEFTKSIVGAISPALGGGRAAVVAAESRGTDNLEAYDYYLKGRYFFAQRGGRSLTEAAKQFRLAIAADPRFARAHAGLSLTLGVLPQYVAVDTDSVLTLAIQSGRRAVALDSTVADAHTGLAQGFTSRLDFAQSERHYKRAIALDPENATARLWYGIHLQLRGEIERGLAEVRRASELDPLSVVAGGNVAMSLYVTRQYSEAISQSRRMLQLDSTNWLYSYQILGLAHIFNGSADSGLRAIEHWERRNPDEPIVRGSLIFANAAAGRWTEARRLGAEIERRESRASITNRLLARLALGNRPGALDVLEEMAENGEMLVGLNSPGCEPMMDLLKSEPRYLALMRKHKMRICPATTPWPIRPPPG